MSYVVRRAAIAARDNTANTDDTANIAHASNTDDAAEIARVQVAGWRAAYRGLVADHVLEGLEEAGHTSDWRRILSLPSSAVFVAVPAASANGIVGFCDVGPSRDANVTADTQIAGTQIADTQIADTQIADTTYVATDTSELRAFYVAPEVQRHGVGTLLAQAAFEWARAARFTRITVWTIDQNWPAHAFYRSLGFDLDGTDKVDIIGGEPVRDVRFARDV